MIHPHSAHPLLPANVARLAELSRRAVEQDREPDLAAVVRRCDLNPSLASPKRKSGKPAKVVYSDLGERWDSLSEAGAALGVGYSAVARAVQFGYRCRGRRVGYEAFGVEA
jgi:hypothetical protein